MPRIDRTKKELISEDYCFVCKDGGELIICDHGNCLKAYHPSCVGVDTSFIETETQWKCGWHSCFLCKKNSNIKCFCCPTSICQKCFKRSDFVRVKKNSRGFCRRCLKLAIMVEENTDIDSDGEKVDFKDTETCEFLFKEYWNIIKDHEKLSLQELRVAYTSLKNGNHLEVEFDSETSEDKDETEFEATADVDFKYDDTHGNVEFSDIKGVKLQDKVTSCIPQFRSKTGQKKHHVDKIRFSGWGSELLINFLTSIGKDCRELITQLDASDIIKKYIMENKLLHPVKKKKKVLCDDNLYYLFKKKSIKLLKIHDLLECHYSENLDENILSSSEEEDLAVKKRQKTLTLEPRSVSNFSESCYASIVEKNIKLMYLRRSFILELLKNLEDFENKVIGCFVRVKNDPKNLIYSRDKLYVLSQVTGIKRTQQTFKIGEINTDFVFCISNVSKDVQISMISDDDFEEEELEDLRQSIKAGVHERLTIAEVKHKLLLLHEDITRHWIKRELAILQKQIERANEKGWRRELYEMIDRRELLRKESEQARLLKEIPGVIPDIELVSHANLSSLPPTKEKEDDVRFNEMAQHQDRFSTPVPKASVCKMTSSEAKIKYNRSAGAAEDQDIENEHVELICKKLQEGLAAANYNTASNDEVLMSFAVHKNADCTVALIEHESEKKESGDAVDNNVSKNSNKRSGVAVLNNGVDDDDSMTKNKNRGEEETLLAKQTSSMPQVIDIDDDDNEIKKTEIIDLDGDEDDARPVTLPAPTERKSNKSEWNYLDPNGNLQGPFKLQDLRLWRIAGWFDDDFKIWKVNQSQDEAILLIDALRKNS